MSTLSAILDWWRWREVQNGGNSPSVSREERRKLPKSRQIHHVICRRNHLYVVSPPHHTLFGVGGVSDDVEIRLHEEASHNDGDERKCSKFHNNREASRLAALSASFNKRLVRGGPINNCIPVDGGAKRHTQRHSSSST